MKNFKKTETDLEVSINRVISQIPWIPSEKIRHQANFSIVLGKKTIDIKNTNTTYKQSGRADIILYNESDEPLAVIELKRNDIKLEERDMEQGRSYALLLNPKLAPLVIVTNGKDTRFYETYTGKPWEPNAKTEESFKKLISNVATLADADIASAVSSLMGEDENVWKCAIEQITMVFLKDQTATKEFPNSPFLEDFNIPRVATKEVRDLLLNRQKLIVVRGDPLSGKSNVLKQVSFHKNFTSLYLDVSSSEGIYQTVADALSESLNWHISKDDARSWLLQISKNSSHQLVLLVDGLQVNNDNVIKEISLLSSQNLGNSLSLVVAMDSNCADKIFLNHDLRSISKIGKNAKTVNVKSGLTDNEFMDVENFFKNKNIFFENGANYEPHYRQPWILRALFCSVQDKLPIYLPPFLNKEFLQITYSRFENEELIRLFSKLAEERISKEHENKNPESILLSYHVYFFYRRQLEQLFKEKDFDFLFNYDYLKILGQKSNDQILLVNIPELLVSRIIANFAEKILDDIRNKCNVDDIVQRLIQQTTAMPLGSFIAAQSINQSIDSPETLLMLSTSLLKIEPKFSLLSEGTKIALCHSSNGKMLEISLDKELGKQKVVENINSWLTLSYLLIYIYEDDGGKLDLGAYSNILLKLGAFKSILKSANSYYDAEGHYSHHINEELETPCNHIGISEPITYAIFLFLKKSKKDDINQWLDKVMDEKSLALLNRVAIALIKLKKQSIFFDEIYQKLCPELELLFSKESNKGAF